MIIQKAQAPGLILPVYCATQHVQKKHSRVCSFTIRTYGTTQVEAMMKMLDILCKTGEEVSA